MESYYAKIENNVVTSVEVVTDEFFNANPERYKGKWIKVGEGSLQQYCGRGYIYLPEKDKIIIPSPYPSWKLDVNDIWQAPIDKPDDGKDYVWNEDMQEWDLIIL